MPTTSRRRRAKPSRWQFLRRRIALAVLILLGLVAAAAVVALAAGRPEIDARQNGDALFMTWSSTGDDLYEVQGRTADGEWRTFAFVQSQLMMLTLPGPGVFQFRCRGWSKDGPGLWSKPTERFLLTAPAAVEEDEETEEEALFAPFSEES